MSQTVIPGRQDKTMTVTGVSRARRLLEQTFGFTEVGLLLAVIAFGVLITIVNPTFLSVENLLNVARVSAFTFIVACGMTFCFVGGGLDLSVGSIYAVAGISTALALKSGVPLFPAILLGLLAGMVLGLVNGLVTTRFNIPALIVTLGMQFSVRGIVMVVTKGTPVSPVPSTFKWIGQGSLAGIPNPILLAAVIGLVSIFVLEYTKFGYAVHGVGGNKEAARVCGIPVKRIQIWLYVITGFASAFAGILMAARLGSVSPNSGVSLEMTVISAVIIGGTSLFGGIGTILGTLLGSILLNMITNGIALMGVDAFWQNLVMGTVIIVAVGIDQYRRATLWRAR